MKRSIFSGPARADVRRLDKPTAIRIFAALHRFAESGHADIKQLKDEDGEFRLRVGDFRVRFVEEPGDILRIHSVRHRSEAYR